MGWKTSMIIINSEQEFNINEVFNSIGCFDLVKSDKKSFETIMNPEDGKIYIGKYHGNTIICMQDLPLHSMNQNLSQAETTLTKKFPDTEIITFVLHSVVNLWGYAIAKNGKKIKARAGNADDGITVDFGEVLEEEKELFAQSKINDSGERKYIFDGVPDEEFSDDQVGENFVFDLSAKYLGDTLDDCDPLFETEFEGYTYSKVKPKIAEPVPAKETTTAKVAAEPVLEASNQNNEQSAPLHPPVEKVKKKWWQFWK